METGDLVKRMTAHFQRIVEIKSLVVGSNNEIITSSIDRCIKIWNLDYIFQKERHIDKHELTIDALSISTSAGIAVTVTRSCLGVWDFMTGHLLFKLNNSALGAIITHGLVNEVHLYRILTYILGRGPIIFASPVFYVIFASPLWLSQE